MIHDHYTELKKKCIACEIKGNIFLKFHYFCATNLARTSVGTLLRERGLNNNQISKQL